MVAPRIILINRRCSTNRCYLAVSTISQYCTSDSPACSDAARSAASPTGTMLRPMNLRKLPTALRACIERGRAERELEFTEARNRLPSFPVPHTSLFEKPADAVRRLLIKQITLEALKVAHCACVSAKNGELNASDIRALVEMLLRIRCLELCPDVRNGASDKFWLEVKERLFGLPEWEVHLKERLEAVNAQTATGTLLADAAPAQDSEPPTDASLPVDANSEQERQAAQGIVAAATANIFRRMPDGGGWEIQHGGQRKKGLRHLEGFELIRQLLERPRTSIAAVTLIGRDATSEDADHTPAPLSAGSPAVDTKTRSEVEAEIRDLKHKIEIADDVRDSSRASELREQV